MGCDCSDYPLCCSFPQLALKTSKEKTKKGSKNSPKVDLVGVNARLTHFTHTMLKGPSYLFCLNAHIKLAWLNELLCDVAQQCFPC